MGVGGGTVGVGGGGGTGEVFEGMVAGLGTEGTGGGGGAAGVGAMGRVTGGGAAACMGGASGGGGPPFIAAWRSVHASSEISDLSITLFLATRPTATSDLSDSDSSSGAPLFTGAWTYVAVVRGATAK